MQWGDVGRCGDKEFHTLTDEAWQGSFGHLPNWRDIKALHDPELSIPEIAKQWLIQLSAYRNYLADNAKTEDMGPVPTIAYRPTGPIRPGARKRMEAGEGGKRGI